MIEDLKSKISHFRSELFLGRYQQAYTEGEYLTEIIESIIKGGLETDHLKRIAEDVSAEMELAKKLIGFISNGAEKKIEPKKTLSDKKSVSKGKNPSKSKGKSTGKKEGVSKGKKQDNEVVVIENNLVGKWGKKKDSPVKKKEQKVKLEKKKSEKKIQVKEVKCEISETEVCEEGQPLEKDECDILERQIILPIQLPSFFKAKEPHRLIVCYYLKCSHVMKILQEAFQRNCSFVELNDLEEWSGNQTRKEAEKISIYVAPLMEESQNVLKAMLEKENVIVVLYANKNRMIATEKFSMIESDSFSLTF